MDLVCLQLNKLDVILGMNWLKFNHVYINYFNKTISFLELDEDKGLFVYEEQVDKYLKDVAYLFMMLASTNMENQATVSKFPVVFEFPKVFPNDISGLSPEIGIICN